MKAAELRTQSKEELKTKLLSLHEERFRSRMRASSPEAAVKVHVMRQLRKDIARIKTVLKELSNQAKA
ncbi:MAG: 50S ribosomal protein L29 [Gammaproteobacteria bacterium RIFCSPLOWO2_02_FULL_42_14]|nr:MAG: 50S ribosomal protein L29 [Gammaproteobacteria bacterium RIFCSPHIGHO2_02_FULL_42_43]OGT28747.1 MAG: 50S ribosomal protein L29 [Gammaproteobacteria bacterium RIFCSPHIGHO2_01_FULL_42_8]OGT52178.1 MAG: 50S ribosomal protein L29 [Gammaproteobacteria bacterium RIFCSPHIGHO2_12_FULL_41_25]OGT62616.1 MAG: 50S ribosomal protein L29 [Gammaproteobacteria bacterium RIFCSPLOWO2_02_FULL_42_14]OGT86598.1 MAG: 50S ribosomal protein L29 [Gammaproteobacteria bacterium RIFCSPLOWO2_12_FULL_42_18]